MKKLGVNIDHIATLRNARGISDPSPLAGALLAERAGADNITCHLREDRRHIRDQDVSEIMNALTVPLNLEMAATDEMIAFAISLQPAMVTLVPEKRQERTTEGGLDLLANQTLLERSISVLITMGIEVSLFIEPDLESIQRSFDMGCSSIELHTGNYAIDFGGPDQMRELNRLFTAASHAHDKEMNVHVGHGLNRKNIGLLNATIPWIESFQVGHSIIGDAVFVGIEKAVLQIKGLINPPL